MGTVVNVPISTPIVIRLVPENPPAPADEGPLPQAGPSPGPVQAKDDPILQVL